MDQWDNLYDKLSLITRILILQSKIINWQILSGKNSSGNNCTSYFIFKTKNTILYIKKYLRFAGKIISQDKNLKRRKIILLINFIFAQTLFLIALSQILKNDAILINYRLFLQKKILYNLTIFNFWKWINYYQIR